MPKDPLILKLEHGAELTDEDRVTLNAVARRSWQLSAHKDIIEESENPEGVHLVIAGVACRYKVLENGNRQIVALLIPGDFCDLHTAILGPTDHGLATLTPCTVVEIPRETIMKLTGNPRINRALSWASLVDEVILREWIVNIGQRPAAQRVAHLYCELLVRLQTVHQATEDSYELPLTQEELADVLGLSIVHVNRTLQYLRGERMITYSGRTLKIHDVERLQQFAGFNPHYLHLKPRSETAAQRTDTTLQT